MNSESKRTKQWQKNNPIRYLAYQIEQRERKVKLQQESIRNWERSPHKTPIAAIRAYCRSKCGSGFFHGGFPKAPVTCETGDCPLFAYRNGDPRLIARGIREDHLKGYRSAMDKELAH